MLLFLLLSLAVVVVGGTLPSIPAGTAGQSGTGYTRILPSDYPGDGTGTVMRGGTEPVSGTKTSLGLPTARRVSEAILSRPTMYGRAPRSMLYHSMGVIITHDLSLVTRGTTETMSSPCGDPQCGGSGYRLPPGTPHSPAPGGIPFARSVPGTGSGVRSHVNGQTHYLDLSSLYGPTPSVTSALRLGTGGLLSMDDHGPAYGEYLPVTSDPRLTLNARGIPGGSMASGDPRNIIHPGAAALTNVFAREHNRVARLIAASHGDLGDEELFQAARVVTTKRYRTIVTQEYLAVTTGNRLDDYGGYDVGVDPRVSQAFAIAAFRFGHSGAPGQIDRVSPDGSPSVEGPLLIRDAFFDHRPAYPDAEREGNGTASATRLEDILRGMAMTEEPTALDARIVDDMRQHMAAFYDLAALNIMRGRDHGLPGYGTARKALNLTVPKSFADFAENFVTDHERETALTVLPQLYDSIDDVDLWVAGLMEKGQGVADVGETFSAIIMDQFRRLRDGDPSWTHGNVDPDAFKHTPGIDESFVRLMTGGSPDITALLQNAEKFGTLGSLIKDNTRIGDDFPTAAMSVIGCSLSLTSTGLPGGSSGVSSDGLFSAVLRDDLTLVWSIDETLGEIDITLIGPSGGYMAIGFGAQTMVDLDIWFTFVAEDGRPRVHDKFARSFDPSYDDPSNPEGDVVPGSVRFGRETEGDTNIGAVQIPAGFHAISFRRRLDTGDVARDRPIARGRTDIAFSLGTSMAPLYHGPRSRGGASIDFFEGQLLSSTSSTGVYNLQVLHGAAMIIGWGGFLPLGVAVARFGKGHLHWLTAHRILQSLGSASTIPLMAAAISSVAKGHGATIHAVLGLCFLGLLITQLVTGNALAVLMPRRALYSAGPYLRPAHRAVGWLMLCASPYQIYEGFERLAIRWEYRIAYLSWIGLVFLVMIVLDVRGYFKDAKVAERQRAARERGITAGFADVAAVAVSMGSEDRKRSSVSGDDPRAKLERAIARAKRAVSMSSASLLSLPDEPHDSSANENSGLNGQQNGRGNTRLDLITPAGLASLTAQGRRVVIIGGLVVDVEEWIQHHPGGAFALLDRLGTHATEAFEGRVGNDGDGSGPGVGSHRHSWVARERLRKMAIGRYLAVNDHGSAETRLDAVANLESFTWEQIEEETNKGALWIVVEGFILDVSSFFHAHPGGGKVLLSRIGTNATEAFRGRGGPGSHVHSERAQEMLRSLVLGRVDGAGRKGPDGTQGSATESCNVELIVGKLGDPDNPSPRLPPRGSVASIADPFLSIHHGRASDTGSIVSARRASMASVADIWIVCRVVSVTECSRNPGVFVIVLSPPDPLGQGDGGRDGEDDEDEDDNGCNPTTRALLDPRPGCHLRLRPAFDVSKHGTDLAALESRSYTPFLGTRRGEDDSSSHNGGVGFGNGGKSNAPVRKWPSSPHSGMSDDTTGDVADDDIDNGGDHPGAAVIPTRFATDPVTLGAVFPSHVPLGSFAIAVRCVSDGAVSPRLCALSVGDAVEAEGPHGREWVGSFAGGRGMVALVAGTGVVPVVRLLETIADHDGDPDASSGFPRSLRIVAQCRETLILERHLSRLVRLCAGRGFDVSLSVLRSKTKGNGAKRDGEQGGEKMSIGHIEAALGSLDTAADGPGDDAGNNAGSLVVVCGPPSFEDGIAALAREAGPNDEVVVLR